MRRGDIRLRAPSGAGAHPMPRGVLRREGSVQAPIASSGIAHPSCDFRSRQIQILRGGAYTPLSPLRFSLIQTHVGG